MYELKSTDRGLEIDLGGSALISGIVPEIVLDDGRRVEPDLIEAGAEPAEDRWGAFTHYEFVYADPGDAFVLDLGFRVYPTVLVADITYRGPGEDRIGEEPPGLAASGGITLRAGRLGDLDGLMANYLFKDWWTRPYFETDLTGIPARTQSLVWKDSGRYHHLLPVCDTVLKTELQGGEAGLEIVTAAYDAGYCNVSAVTFALASDEDPFILPDRTARAGMRALGTPAQMRIDKRYPEAFEYLGWCSWDAFYHEVNADGLVEKAQELNDKDIPVRWFIIDDGWLSVEDGRLTAFEPDGARFPDGLLPLADALKGRYGIGWLGVWHTLFGYWQGIHPESELAQAHREALYTTHAGKVMPQPDTTRGFAFWNAWHTALRRAGVDFVKVDYQSGLPTYLKHERAIGTAATHAHGALEASVGKNFDMTMINCMGMASENLWHRPTSSVTRNSDDFFPTREGSFAEHVLQNAYNAYYHAPFMWLDWDMWWTEHEHAATHAVLRAVSGGPVYVSDRVGETDPAQLRPLILSDGRVLRCDRPGVVTEDGLMRDPNREPVPLKVWNRVGDAGVVAAVNANVAGIEVEGSVGPEDVPGLEGERFAAFEHFSREARVIDRGARLPVALKSDGCILYHFIPVVSSVTPVGLIDRYISAAALADWQISPERATIVLLDGGTFGWIAETPPTAVRVNGAEVPFETHGDLHTVACAPSGGAVWVEIITEA